MLSKLKIPLLLMAAVIIILIMLRLAIWQLDRAEQKQLILDQVSERATLPTSPLSSLLHSLDFNQLKYRNVSIEGVYLPEKSIYIDNQVLSGQVGYLVFTPFKVDGLNETIMVNRGWIGVGDSRETLPEFMTSELKQTLFGRLNTAPPQPPLWNDDYPVAQGSVWAYLPLDEYASQMNLTLLPLVVELASQANLSKDTSVKNVNDEQFKIAWSEINDEWVAKHKGYAFQWFVMAIAFLIACVVLVVRVSTKKSG